MPILVPKIVWPSGGGNELIFAFPPVNVRPFDRTARRHDTIASSGKRQSLLERTDKFLELDITLVPTEVENYLTRTEELDHTDWVKSGAATPTVTANATIAPDGTLTAERVEYVTTGVGEFGHLDQNAFSKLSEVDGRRFVFSVFLRAATGGQTIELILNDGVSAFGVSAPVIQTGWQRFNVSGVASPASSALIARIRQTQSQGPKDFFAWGAQLAYDVLGPYIKTQAVIPAAIDRWDTFITAVLGGTNFDYYPDAFAAGFTTYVLEDKVWRPKLQVRGANRFYEFKLRFREFV